jgi:hypothetical protein
VIQDGFRREKRILGPSALGAQSAGRVEFNLDSATPPLDYTREAFKVEVVAVYLNGDHRTIFKKRIPARR